MSGLYAGPTRSFQAMSIYDRLIDRNLTPAAECAVNGMTRRVDQHERVSRLLSRLPRYRQCEDGRRLHRIRGPKTRPSTRLKATRRSTTAGSLFASQSLLKGRNGELTASYFG